MHSGPEFLHVSRRDFFRKSGLTLGTAALGSLLSRESSAAIQPHFAPKAKNVIYLHMIGAPSQLDLFDYKPVLQQHDGQKCPDELIKGKKFAFLGGELSLAGTEFKFKKHGQSGAELSELLPHLGTVADDICIVKSLHTNEINHAPAQMFLHTGFGRGGRPSFGCVGDVWPRLRERGSARVRRAAELPARRRGLELVEHGLPAQRVPGHPVPQQRRACVVPQQPEGAEREGSSPCARCRARIESGAVQYVGDPEIATRISQYEMAYRMQTSVPG